MELNAGAKAAFDAMREGITIIDTEGRLVFCNRAYLDFLRKELGEPLDSVEGIGSVFALHLPLQNEKM